MTKDVKVEMEEYATLLPVHKSISMPEAEKRAGMFLQAQANITEYRHLLNEEKIRLQSVQSAVYAEELSKCTGKTVTENKVTVDASEAYQNAREDFERIDNDMAYLKAYYDIFNNAHVFYRQMAKGESM